MTTTRLFLGIALVEILIASMFVFTYTAEAQAINPPVPDAVICRDPQLVSAAVEVLYSVNDDGSYSYGTIGGRIYQNDGTLQQGSATDDCFSVNLFDLELGATSTPRAVNFGYSTTSNTTIVATTEPSMTDENVVKLVIAIAISASLIGFFLGLFLAFVRRSGGIG
jgi:hypothetical protein